MAPNTNTAPEAIPGITSARAAGRDDRDSHPGGGEPRFPFRERASDGHQRDRSAAREEPAAQRIETERRERKSRARARNVADWRDAVELPTLRPK